MIRLLLTIVIIELFLSTIGFANDSTVTVKGIVYDEQQIHLTGVSVSIHEIKRGTITNINGYYEIIIPQGKYKITYSIIGYKPKELAIDAHSNTTKNITLQSQDVQGKEIIVSEDRTEGRKTSGTSQVIGKEELDKHLAQTLGETLQLIPGVTVLQTGPSISKPIIRGLHSDRVAIISDNVQQHAQEWGEEHAPAIDPFSIDEIEVIKGVNAIEYSSSAIGGVIKTKSMALDYKTIFKGNASYNFFSNNLQSALKAQGQGAFNLFDIQSAWLVQGSGRIAADAQTPSYGLTNTAFREYDVLAKLGFKKDDFSVSLSFNRFANLLGIFSGSEISNISSLVQTITNNITPVQRTQSFDVGFPKQTIAHEFGTLNFNYANASFGKLDVVYGFQHNVQEEYDLFVGAREATITDPPAMQLHLWTNSLQAKYSFIFLNEFEGKVGLESKIQQNFNGGVTSLIPDYFSYNIDGFAESSWSKDQLNLSFGARYSFRGTNVTPYRNSFLLQNINTGSVPKQMTYHTFSAIVGSVFFFSSEHSISANVSMMMRSPNVNEFYSEGLHNGSAQYEIGNSKLVPEKSYTLDMGYRFKTSQVSGEISFFGNFISDFIYLFPLTTPIITVRGVYPAFQYQQNNSVLFGVDGYLDYYLLEWLRLDVKLSSSFGYNLDKQEPLYRMPSPRMTLGIHFDIPDVWILQKNFVEISVEGVLKQYLYPIITSTQTHDIIPNQADYQNYLSILSNTPSGYGLLNISLGTKFNIGREISFSVSLYDVLNLSYRDYLSRFRFYADAMGRNIVVRIHVPFVE